MSTSSSARLAQPALRKHPGRNGFKYRPQFGLIIQCSDEADQQQTYARLRRQGFKLKVVCV